MRTNRTFWRAVHSLAHPLSMAAVLLLLVNDHWLRYHNPSWLTGKLGDFTWLIFAPLIAAMALAWIVPRRVERHTQIVGAASFAFIGLWFALAKTVPAVYHLTKTAWEAIVGWEGTLRMDATDLLTLPALLLGGWVWRRAADSPLTLRPVAYVVWALGIMATLASTEPVSNSYIYTDYGVNWLCQGDGHLFTKTPGGGSFTGEGLPNPPIDRELTIFTNIFTSNDGGLRWQRDIQENHSEVAWNSIVRGDIEPECPQPDILADPNDPLVQYRWESGQQIERSTDGGQTWSLEYDLYELREDVRRLYNHHDRELGDWTEWGVLAGQQRYSPGPLGGIIDAETGNVVFAMGLDGVLVRTPAGEWHWVAVGGYHLADIQGQIQGVFFETWLAGALAFLVITTSTAYMRQRQIRLRWLFLGIGWVAWTVLTLWGLPAYNAESATDDYLVYFVMGLISLTLLIFIAIPLSVGAVWDIARNFRRLAGHIALAAVTAGALFILPLILWAQGTIPRYGTAHIFALLLAASGVLAGAIHLRRVLPVLEKIKPVRVVHVYKATKADQSESE